MKVTEKAFQTGSQFPELKKDTLRIYSMRFCPYAQRTRMVLAHKGIDCETVNVDLKQKPEWFLKRNPLGKVPVLELNDEVVYESVVCNEYLEDLYPQNKLQMDDPYIRARHKMLLEHFGVVISCYYAALRASEDERQEHVDKAQKELDRFEAELEGATFFGDEKLAFLDFHIWPYIERMPMCEALGVVFMPKDRYPLMYKWIEAMRKTPAVTKTAFDTEMHLKFIVAYKNGSPNFDVGLE